MPLSDQILADVQIFGFDPEGFSTLAHAERIIYPLNETIGRLGRRAARASMKRTTVQSKMKNLGISGTK